MMLGSLGLEEPWYIEGAEFKAEEKALHIYIGIRDNAEIACPRCGSATRRYGYEPSERIWRHGDCLFYPTYVHCQRPRVQCPHCGVVQVNAPFERKNSRFTLMFEGYAMLLMADMPVLRVAKLLRCDEKSLPYFKCSGWLLRMSDDGRSEGSVFQLIFLDAKMSFGTYEKGGTDALWS